MKINELLQALKDVEINCSEEQLNLLNVFMKSTLETNEKFNLTAITKDDEFVEKMIYDSALSLYDLDLTNKSIIDVGTGAGFPGMVIKILKPESKVTLLDSTKKKIDYLLDFAKTNNIEVEGVSSRAEDYARNNREKYDFATARAVSQLNILLELIIPMLKVGGSFIALKGQGYEEEINSSKEAFRRLNCRVQKIYEFELPESHEKRAIIHIVKDKETNKKYPRQYTDIKRQPL
ncbi:MAG: 16S rRNA (guanine(527)-N(7))-methyltransferase RsmG [Bacilli bacterium]|nr:16S rRNA (guanine(527)-N(7))-methyltransferase RsmG [Bacilli bacterium]